MLYIEKVPVINTDITVVGAGIAGLYIAKECIDRGYRVGVIEKAEALAAGSTTRNEGWLHAGTYHAAAIDDEHTAIEVAQKVKYGHRIIKGFAPEAIDHATTYALLGADAAGERAVSRWDAAAVRYKHLSQAELPNDPIDIARPRTICAVGDVSINSRLLCSKLARYIVDRGGIVMCGTTFNPEGAEKARLIVDSKQYIIQASRFIITAGNEADSVIEQVTGQRPRVRYFKSHLLVFPRLTQHNYFYVDGGETGYMNHGDMSVAGLNRDSLLLETPNYEPVDAKAHKLVQALHRLVPAARGVCPQGNMKSVACVKPDMPRGFTNPELGEEIFDIAEGYTVAFPGKMTQAPFLAHLLMQRIFEQGIMPWDYIVASSEDGRMGQSHACARPLDAMC